jgi:threonine/homoserine/homoserine lactone efflux protein
MDFVFFVRGLMIGFSIAAVVGPIGVLCIHRTMQKGFLYGLVTGMGAATADGIYGCVAAFGITVIITLLIHQIAWIHLIGGLFLIYLGIRAALSRPAERAASAQASNFLGAYLATLLLTLTNPLTILSFTAVLAGLGVGIGGNSVSTALLVVCGVFLGSGLWWVLLAGGVSLLRARVNECWLLWSNRISGSVIVLFGVYALVSLRW